MKLDASSQRWLARQARDPYVKRARQAGYRSRAAYKLLEIQAKDQMIKTGMRILDLGAAPGSWSQVARQLIGPTGKIIAVDLLPMQAIEGVCFLQGDLQTEEIQSKVQELINSQRFDLILADLAPTITGISVVDQSRVISLAELVLTLTHDWLKLKGTLIVKLFQGIGFDNYLKIIRINFSKVSIRKPPASRSESREVYLIAKNFHLLNH